MERGQEKEGWLHFTGTEGGSQRAAATAGTWCCRRRVHSCVHHSAFTPNAMPRQKQAGLRGNCAAVSCVALVSDCREAWLTAAAWLRQPKGWPRLNFMQTLGSVRTIAAVQQEGLIKNEAEMLRSCHSVTWRDSVEWTQPWCVAVLSALKAKSPHSWRMTTQTHKPNYGEAQ